MIKEYQVTVMCENGKYKPVSCIIKREQDDVLTIGKEAFTREVRKAGIIKICQKRGWTAADLKRFGYTRVLAREYDRERIAEANAARYEAIKEAHYASGEWQRPKK